MSVKAILTEQQKSYTKAEEDALLATKQNTLTFDTTPTSGSTNPATSGGIATALDGRLPQPENAGAVGQVLTKTATGSIWQTQSSGGDIVAAASNSYAVTLYAASWSSQQQTIATPTGAEITSTSDGVLGLSPNATAAQVEAFQLAKIIVISQSSSGVVVKALGIVPTINLPCELILFMKADYYNKDYIDTYMAPLDTPTFIGQPKAPTAAAGTNTTQIATTAFVEQAKNTRVPVNGLGKNLLENAYFIGVGDGSGGTFPINQRLNTQYTSEGWCIDRWYLKGTTSTLSIGNATTGITLTAGANILQFVHGMVDGHQSILDGKTVTLSIKVSSVTGTGKISIAKATGIASNVSTISNTTFDSPGVYKVTGVADRTGSNRINYLIQVDTNSSIVVDAIKLELGSEQTLAHQENGVWVLNEIPDWGTEFTRCISSFGDSGDNYSHQKPAGRSLLWTNSSSGNAFAPQTITMTAGFLVYLIVFRVSTTAASRYDYCCALNTGTMHNFITLNSPSSGTASIMFRTITKNADGNIEIGQCETRSITATSRTVDNTQLIPEYIYGIS